MTKFSHVLIMRKYATAVLFLLLISVAYPAMAADDNRYSYISVQSIDVNLTNTTANITVHYQLDGGATFILFFLGKNDLRQKLEKILNYEDPQVTSIDMDSASFTVENVSYRYGDGIYWFPRHEFGITSPMLVLQTPRLIREYSNTSEFPNGIGYFG
ncbi:MAG: hypothetical protein ABFC24_07985 [Methanoregulaceae archaeon]